MNGTGLNRRTLAVLVRLLPVALIAILLFGGLGLFHAGAEKEHILHGVGLDSRAEHADGVALMVAGAFFVLFALLGGIATQLTRLARRQRNLETIANALRDDLRGRQH